MQAEIWDAILALVPIESICRNGIRHHRILQAFLTFGDKLEND